MQRAIRMEDAAQAFREWRRSRGGGAGGAGKEIPEEFWVQAVDLARVHGVGTTARRLRLNQTRLKHRCSSEAQRRVGFVELSASELPVAGEFVVEMEDDTGTRVRVVLRGVSVAAATAAAKELWSAAH